MLQAPHLPLNHGSFVFACHYDKRARGKVPAISRDGTGTGMRQASRARRDAVRRCGLAIAEVRKWTPAIVR